MLPELFVRRSNFFSQFDIVDVGSGPNQVYSLTLEYETPGWIAFDFAAEIAHNLNGNLTSAKTEFYVNDVLRFEAQGSYAFPRVYIYVDEGTNKFEWKTNDRFQADDWLKVRAINGTAFEKVELFSVIEQAAPPQPLQEINRFPILNGYDRFQQSGPAGVEIDMSITFAPDRGRSGQDLYMEFTGDFPNFYVLRYNYGLFGGTITDFDSANKGPITYVDATLHSPQRTSHHVTRW